MGRSIAGAVAAGVQGPRAAPARAAPARRCALAAPPAMGDPPRPVLSWGCRGTARGRSSVRGGLWLSGCGPRCATRWHCYGTLRAGCARPAPQGHPAGCSSVRPAAATSAGCGVYRVYWCFHSLCQTKNVNFGGTGLCK